MKQSKDSILQTSLYNFNLSSERIKLDEAIRQKVLEPKEKIEINIHPVLTNSKIISLKSFIVKHNDILGPAKGGIRMTSDVCLDDITGLAMEMTWKTSLIGAPFGGGKSGIRCDPASFSLDAKESIIRAFTRGARH